MHKKNSNFSERFKQETSDRWEEYRTNGKIVPNDEVLEWLDSWGTDHAYKNM